MPTTRTGEATPIADLLTTAQVARLLRRNVRTVHRMVGAAQLTATRVPGYKGPFLFDPEEVERVRRELGDELADESPPAAPQAKAS